MKKMNKKKEKGTAYNLMMWGVSDVERRGEKEDLQQIDRRRAVLKRKHQDIIAKEFLQVEECFSKLKLL